MDFNLTPEVLRSGLIFYILIVASLCLRTYAQAWMASRLGDPTPAQTGTFTLCLSFTDTSSGPTLSSCVSFV